MAFLLALALVVSVMSGLGLSVSAEQESNTPGTEEVQQQDKTEAGAAPSEVKAEEEAAKPEEKPVLEEKADEQKTEAKENADKPAEKQEKATPKAGENVQTATIGTGDKTVTVKTTAAAGVLPEGAKLVVKKLANQDQAYQDAESTLKDSQVTYDDFLALDVGFEVNGKEVEPEAGSVQVQFELGAGLLPETADTSTLAVQHLTDGKAETVADAGAVTAGDVTVKNEVVKADFEVQSFSSFTITWRYGYRNYTVAKIHYVDEAGQEIDTSVADVKATNGQIITLAGYGHSIEGYTYSTARYASYNGTEVVSIVMNDNNTQTLIGKNGETVVEDLTDSWVFNKNIYLVYTKNGSSGGGTGGSTGEITLPEPSHVKKAVRRDDGSGIYDLSLDVSGSIGSEEKKVPLDVIMIIDRSGSMKNNDKIGTVKSAANNLITTLNENSGIEVRYNIIAFDGTYDPDTNVADSYGWKSTASGATADVEQVNADYSKWSKRGGTNYQAGIREAIEQLKSARDGAQTVVIFFTDGVPTFRITNRQWEKDNDGYSGYYGTGNSDNQGLNIAAAEDEIKNMHASRFYAVGTEDSGETNLKKLANNVNAAEARYYKTSDTAIGETFRNITSEITKLTCTNVSIIDTLNNNAQIVKNAEGKTPLTITVTDKDGKVIATKSGADEVTLTLNEGVALTASYDEKTKQTKLDFPDNYSLEENYTYTVTTPIEPTEAAYKKYREQNSTYLEKPDAATGTHADNDRENGFYCNNTAQLKYNNSKGDKTVDYDKPVIQLTPGALVIEKTIIANELTDAQVEALENALTFKYKLNNGTEQSAKLTKWTKTANGTYTASATVATGLSPDTEYTVTEDADSAKVEGYDVVTDPVSNSGTISKGETKTASFTNTYTKATQDLTITKVIENLSPNAKFELDKSKEYTFTVTAGKVKDVAGKSYTTDKNTSVSFSNSGVATVTIQGEDSIVIKGLPVGGYTVTEQTPENVTGYDFKGATYSSANGEITLTSSEPGQITVTNKYEIKKVDVTVKKVLDGNMYDSTDKFDFTVNGVEKAATLGHNEEKPYTVDYGSTFTVTEEANSKGYELTKVESDKNIGSKINNGYKIDSVTENTTITFTNTKTIQPPNGIITTIAPYAIMVVLAAGAGVYFVYSRRRRNR